MKNLLREPAQVLALNTGLLLKAGNNTRLIRIVDWVV